MKYLINDIYSKDLEYNWIVSTYNKPMSDRIYIAIRADYIKRDPRFFQGYSMRKYFNSYYSLEYLFKVYMLNYVFDDSLFIIDIDIHESIGKVYASTISVYNQNKAAYTNCKYLYDKSINELFEQVNSQSTFKVFEKFKN